MSKKSEKTKILIVEDNLLVNTAVKDILEENGLEAISAEDAKTAEKILKDTRFCVVILDMLLPDSNGKELLKRWREEYPEMNIVFMTAHADVPTAVECLKTGAYDFLVKPVEKNLLIKTVNQAIEHAKMRKQLDVLSQLSVKDVQSPVNSEFIAESDKSKQVLAMANRITASDFSSLLITGESGTGKGMLAKFVHKYGCRAKKPFVEVNCSALPAGLIESELFGHKKGAFTDAKEDKIGLFEMADGGTLFLDEIGDMDFNLQAKLLKVIEEQNFRRIGSVDNIEVDVAIIAATNQDLKSLTDEKKFRVDLYYRLNVIQIHIPPLRERVEDIEPLTKFFIHLFSRKFGKEIKGISNEVLKVLMNYSWPGNVRELRNVIERACILTRSPIIEDTGILFPYGTDVNNEIESQDAKTELIPAMPIRKAEELVIRAAMKEANGNKNMAASILGLHRTTLYKKLEEYNIN